MLKSITIEKDILRHLADKINKEVETRNKNTRSFLSNAIWAYEKKGREDD